MHVLFLTDNFPPETNAPASRTFEHAKRWVMDGHDVTVITCAPNFPSGRVFPGYRNRLRQVETMEGVRVIRVWSYITANEGFLRRTLDYVSFAISSVAAGVFVRRPDVVVATSPQFFCALAGHALAGLKRRPFIFELRDLWPDSIVAVGAMQESRVIRWLRRIEYFLYGSAENIVSVTHSFRSVLSSNGIDPDKIIVVPNGVDAERYIPGPKPVALEERHGLKGKFVAAYVGTVGLAHGLQVLLECASALRHRDDIAFVIVGTGAQRQELEQRCKDEGLTNVVFVGAVSKDEVVLYWKLCDVALVLLRDSPLFAHVLPSKMFEAMGMARPIILGVRGESKDVLEKSGGGIAISPENCDELRGAIERLADDPALGAQLGVAGRKFVLRDYNRDTLASQMLDVLAKAAKRQ